MGFKVEGDARVAFTNVPGAVPAAPDNGEIKIHQADGYLVTRKVDGSSRKTPLDLGTAATKNVGATGGVAPNDLSDLLGATRALRDQALLQPVIPFIVTGTQDGNPTLDQQPAIQAAWDKTTAIGLPIMLSAGPSIIGILDVRINRALQARRSGAKILTDGRVRLHGYFTDFTSVSEVPIGPNIPVGTMIYFGPPDASPVATYISDVSAEKITCVFHPPVNAQGGRVPSLNTVNGVYFDRCINPRAREIDISGLNAGFGFAYTSCSNIDFDGVTVRDCNMVVDPTATDSVNRNKQITGVNADDLFAGRGIPPTLGGYMRCSVYGLTSNREPQQIDGVNDQGARGVRYFISARGVDEALDTYGSGSYYFVDAIDCVTSIKMGHNSSGNTVIGRSRGGTSPVGGGRAAILLFAGNRGDTAENNVTWELSGYTGTRLLGIEGDTPTARSATGELITTKVTNCVVNLIARSCKTLRLMSEGGTGLGNVVNIDIDPASVAASPAGSEAEFLQVSTNPATRITVKRGQNTRPTAPNADAARLQGATNITGYYDQQTGNLVPLSSGLDGTWTPSLTFATPGTGVTYALRSGIYNKNGTVVTVQGRITLSSKGSGGAGLAVISGLPFAAAQPSPIGLPRYSGVALPSGAVLAGFANGGSIALQYTTVSEWVNATYSNVGENFDIVINFQYIAAA